MKLGTNYYSSYEWALLKSFPDRGSHVYKCVNTTAVESYILMVGVESHLFVSRADFMNKTTAHRRPLPKRIRSLPIPALSKSATGQIIHSCSHLQKRKPEKGMNHVRRT